MRMTVKTSGYEMGTLVAVQFDGVWTVGLLAKGHRAYEVTDKAGNRLISWASGRKVIIRTVGVDFPAEVAAFESQVDPCAHCGRADSPRRDDIVKPFPHECASKAEIDRLIGLGTAEIHEHTPDSDVDRGSGREYARCACGQGIIRTAVGKPVGPWRLRDESTNLDPREIVPFKSQAMKRYDEGRAEISANLERMHRDDVLASLATIASTEPMSLPVDPEILADRSGEIARREAARAQAYEASMPVVGDTIYRESDGATGLVDDKTRHGRLVVVFRDGTERSAHWDVLVGEGFERITADDFAMLNPDIVRVVARLYYFGRVLVKDAHLMLDVLPEHVDAARKAGLITEYDEWLSVASKTIELITEADRVDAYLHFNPRPAVPPINSNIPHVFVPKDEGVEGGPSFCVAPCHGHKSMPFHVPATVRPVKLRQPVRTCLARRKRKATKRARARVGGGW